MNVRTIISLTICSLECMFLGGTLIAWAPLLYTFLDDGVFKDRCVYNNITQHRGNTTVEEDCSSQSSLLNIAYTLGIAMVGICGYPFGIIFDRYGLRVSRVIASIISLLGIFSWAFTSAEYSWLVIVGSLFNGMSLQTVNTCNFHAAELAGPKTTTVLAIFSGSLDIAIFWYGHVMVIHKNGFHRKWSLLIISSLWILGTLNTFLLLPKFKVGYDKYGKKQTGVSTAEDYHDAQMNHSPVTIRSKLNETASDVMKTSSSVRSVVHCLSSLLYISHVIWFCVINFRVNLFIGTIVPELMDIYPDDNGKVERMLEVLGYMSLLCVFGAFPFGLVADYLRSKFSGSSQNIWMKARPAQFFLLIPTGLYIALSVLKLVRVDWAIYSTFVLHCLGVTAVYSYASVLISGVFPIPHFGKLYGLMMFFGCLAQFVQVPLLQWAEQSSFQNMLLLVAVVTTAALYHPILIMYKSHKIKRTEINKSGKQFITEKKFEPQN